ncbi:MAG: 4Fe-4S binding protein, partial [Clostridia bacterium]|nr:4Fe-4S binding protein [Clostridia bacterium]
MLKRVIQIDEEKCVGCGMCAGTCKEGAIDIVNGKAKLVREDHCDGLGNCLPACPVGAISFVEKEVPAAPALEPSPEMKAKMQAQGMTIPAGCPGAQSRAFAREESAGTPSPLPPAKAPSRLGQWPVQIKLAPVNAPWFKNARLLIAADCTAFAYGNFHQEFIRNHVTLIGCPKLDEGDYAEKLTEIIKHNDIRDVTIVRMEVPCCGGLENAVKRALQASGKFLPWQVVTIS